MPVSTSATPTGKTLFLEAVMHSNGTALTCPEGDRRFAFVTATPRGQPAAEDRKLIRSHVMRGKNTRKRRPLGRLNVGAAAAILAGLDPEELVRDETSPEESHGSQNGHEMPCTDGFTWCGELSLIPRAASVFDFVTFPEEIDVNARGMLCTCRSLHPRIDAYTLIDMFFDADFTHLKGTMYPIARYSFSDAADAYWFHWTQVDLAYLHSILFTTSFFYDTLTGQKSESTKYHSYRAIRQLNKQLADSKTALLDSTTTVVMSMALVAACFGDLESAHVHFAGLKRIIDLRGGIASYRSRPLLQAKLYRSAVSLFLLPPRGC